MEEFYTKKGDRYLVDLEKERVYKNNILLPSSEVEIVYSGSGEFVGVYYNGANNIITRTGNTVTLTSEADIS
jgi:hypothetical protein